MDPQGGAELCSSQPDVSLHCQAAKLVYHATSLYRFHCYHCAYPWGMARLSWPGSLVMYQDDADGNQSPERHSYKY